MWRRLFVLVMTVLTAGTAAASDFSATAPSGQTLYYNIVTGGVEVTFPANTTAQYNGWNGYTKPTGALTVPAYVSNNGTTYSVVSIHGFAFYECTGLTSVTIPEGVATMGNQVFLGCTSLTQVTLPTSLTSIGASAFYGCTALATITCGAANPPSAVNSTFQNVPTASCVLQVPCQSSNAYATTAPWSLFDSIVSLGCTATVTVDANMPGRGSVSGGGTYDVGTTVVLQAIPTEGHFFVCWNDGDTINPRVVTVINDMSFTAWFFALQYDTLQVHDTLLVHDTTVVNLIVWDTAYIHDTTVVNLMIWDTVYIHDTVTIGIDGTDTIYVHDTTTIHDTVLPTFFRLQVTAATGGVGIGNAVLPAGTVAEIGALPIEGYRFLAWNDGNTDNPRQVTITNNTTFTAEFGIVTGIDEVPSSWTASVDGRMLSVECEAGATVNVFSADGRCLMQHTVADGRLRVWMPAAGVYLVQVDQMPARKVVITK